MLCSDLQRFDTESILKYLAFLQICPENAHHLQVLQELQNQVLNSLVDISNEELWIDTDDSQTGLFVENYICYSGCEFRAFVADATEKPWQLCVLIDSLIRNRIATRKELYPVFFFLCLSDNIAKRLGFGYYELGGTTGSNKIHLLDVDDKKLNSLSFTEEELNLIGQHRIVNFSFLKEYQTEFGKDVGLRPLLKKGDGYFVLSPNAIMNCAWRELLKLMKEKLSDKKISEFYHAALAQEIHNKLSEKWSSNYTLQEKGESVYTAVYMVFHHRYYVVTVAAKETNKIDIDAIQPPAGMEVLDVSSYLESLGKKLKSFDADAEIVHIVIPLTMQNELAVVSSNATTPIVMMQWPPFNTLLEKDEDNPSWLYYYALDRKNSKAVIAPWVKEEDLVALYFKQKHSFYLSDNATGNQMIALEQGYALPLLYDIRCQSNRHSVTDPPFKIVIARDQECPKGFPFYEATSKNNDMMVGEFMISNIILNLPINTKDLFPNLHAVGRSLILWYYALERYSGRPVLMRNLKLTIEQDNSVQKGFLLKDEHSVFTLKVSPDLLGNKDGHSVEECLLTEILCEADKKGYVLNTCYKDLIKEVFNKCPGGLIHRVDDHDYLCDTIIGEKSFYIVDNRRKAKVLEELAAVFNHYPAGLLSVENSKNLVEEMIHYLNKRIITILEQYDLASFLASMMELRDGVIFWHRTLVVRYNYMISFYRFLGSNDPVQERRIHEFVETDLCARCLIEYALMKCCRHGNRVLDLDINAVEELFALMSELVNLGYLSDYYKSPSFDKAIEVLPNGLFAYPNDDNDGLSEYAKYITNDRLENPKLYSTLNGLVRKPDFNESETVFKSVFTEEFGVKFESFVQITTAIIQLLQDNKRGVWLEEIGAFKIQLATAAKVDEAIIDAYVSAFSISEDYHDLSLYPMFNEHDTFPCRYKRKLGLMYRPICVFKDGAERKVSFSYRGFVQSQYNLLENIRSSNYSSVSKVMAQYTGELNKKRGRYFEEGVFELYKKVPGLRCHRSAQIGPNEILRNIEGKALGDIDIMLIDNASHRILLIEAKNYNECKTPYEAFDNERKLLKHLKQPTIRDRWSKKNKALFEFYAKQPTGGYQVASVMLTNNLCPIKFFRKDYRTDVPVVWVRDIIENPMSIFDYGVYE